MTKASRPPRESGSTTSKKRRPYDLSWMVSLQTNAWLPPNPKLEPHQEQAIREYIIKQRWPADSSPEVIAHLTDSAFYAIQRAKETGEIPPLRWSEERRQPLIDAKAAASELVKQMRAMDQQLRTWFSPLGRSGEDFGTLQSWAQAIEAKLSWLNQTAPGLSATHQRNFECDAFVRHLLPDWEEASGKTADRSGKRGGFLNYAADIAEAGALPFDRIAIASVFRIITKPSPKPSPGKKARPNGG
jgi:hypothetical protein